MCGRCHHVWLAVGVGGDNGGSGGEERYRRWWRCHRTSESTHPVDSGASTRRPAASSTVTAPAASADTPHQPSPIHRHPPPAQVPPISSTTAPLHPHAPNSPDLPPAAHSTSSQPNAARYPRTPRLGRHACARRLPTPAPTAQSPQRNLIPPPRRRPSSTFVTVQPAVRSAICDDQLGGTARDRGGRVGETRTICPNSSNVPPAASPRLL
ncbi:hypothetical protein KSP40_PGU021235 [Platanthera guangdongensis]|uniref:Uncharacterized protein n=1 Tax=Platanthera guangdongensis TaxID=2320717 RepID=A0ABR2MKX7_9ASPA